jgi:hypothetical protein
MRGKSGGSFGILLLLVVAAIVMYLFARDTQSVTPTLKAIRDVQRAQSERVEETSPGDAAADTSAEAPSPESASPPALPRLGDMKDATSAHSAAVGDALQSSNQ